MKQRDRALHSTWSRFFKQPHCIKPVVQCSEHQRGTTARLVLRHCLAKKNLKVACDLRCKVNVRSTQQRFKAIGVSGWRWVGERPLK